MIAPEELRRSIDPLSLGFADTSQLVAEPLPWIGQERAAKAARFGLSLTERDYNLFVLGEIGTGRSSLMRSLMQEVSLTMKPPADLCYLHNFAVPERPLAFRLAAGQGKLLKELLAGMVKSLSEDIPGMLASESVRMEEERIRNAFKEKEAVAYRELSRFAEKHHFALRREDGKLVFTLVGEKGQAMLEGEMVSLSIERKVELEQEEESLREEIGKFLDAMRPEEKKMDEAIAELKIKAVSPLLQREAGKLQQLDGIQEQEKFNGFFREFSLNLLENLYLFEGDGVEEKDALERWFDCAKVNLLVDNGGLTCAPVVIEDNPQFRTLFGSIEYQLENDVLVSDFTRIRAGSLFRAHGGFLLLHLSDLLAEPLVLEMLRRFLRSNKAHIEELGVAYSSIAAVSIEPEPVDLDVKLILIGSSEQYYLLAEGDPEFMSHFRIKVDFAESIPGSPATHHATAILVANVADEHRLPHFSCEAVARLLEQAHRQNGDKEYQSANFAYLEQIVLESAAICVKHSGKLVDLPDVIEALAARNWRHNAPEERLLQMVGRGELLISVSGGRIGQINGLSFLDFGDHSFGFPVRITASTVSGRDGLINIEREVALSGPNHDKGVFILQSFLNSLFAHLAPLNLSASLVFEQEYSGVEGDSASAAELFALLSTLAATPLNQSLAVTGAVNLHGEIMPVGGINEKIEGFFNVCKLLGFNGEQGVIIPRRNLRHLMLSTEVIEAVKGGRFSVHAIDHVGEGIELLSGIGAGEINSAGNYPPDTLLGRAQKTLHEYRRAYLASRQMKG